MDLQPLRKLLQIVFDRASAKRSEDEAKRTLGNVDKGLARLKTAAVAVGAALGVAFGLRALINWGRESMRMAREVELGWIHLKTAVDNAGESFRDREQDLQALAAAFDDATIHDDDDFVVGLGRMIDISGDVDASIANMGLAANVAAQFFDGQLEPAIDLVARTSVGYTRQLKQMGIDAGSAQEGLDALAQKSMGAATKAAESQAGVLVDLNGIWGNFREAVGGAMSGTEEAAGVLDLVVGIIKAMTGWVDRNSQTISTWSKGALYVATTAIWGVYNGIAALGNILVGSFALAVGTIARGINLLAMSFGILAEAGGKAAKFIGLEGAGEKMEAFGRKVRELTTDVDHWAASLQEVGFESIGGGIGRLSNLPPSLSGPRTPRPGLPTPQPRASRNQVGTEEDAAAEKEKTEELTEAEKKLNKAREDGARITEQMQTPIGAYIAKLQELERLLALDAISTETYTRAQQQAKEELEAALETPVEAALKAQGDALKSNATMALALGSEYDALGTEEQILLQTMQALADEGIDPLDDRFAGLTDRLAEVREGMQRLQLEAEVAGAVADAVGSTVAAAFGESLPKIAAAKAKQNAILAAEQFAFAAAAAAGLFTGIESGAHIKAAEMHLGVAAAWGGFAAVTGGFSGGGGSGPASAARDVGGRASEKAQMAGTEINVFFEGPGFSALNPKVQRVVLGAIQQIERHAGPNAHVTIDRRLP